MTDLISRADAIAAIEASELVDYLLDCITDMAGLPNPDEAGNSASCGSIREAAEFISAQAARIAELEKRETNQVVSHNER